MGEPTTSFVTCPTDRPIERPTDMDHIGDNKIRTTKHVNKKKTAEREKKDVKIRMTEKRNGKKKLGNNEDVQNNSDRKKKHTQQKNN